MPSDARILIVDDHEDTLYALESALAPLGYQLGRATSGDEALKQVLRGQVGLLLLDVRMPGVSGLDVVRYMRRLEQTQHIPVVLLTGFGPDHELTSAAFGLINSTPHSALLPEPEMRDLLTRMALDALGVAWPPPAGVSGQRR